MQPIEVVNIQTNDEPIQNQALEEARRQFQICNACRYCESYCSVFPALHRQRELEDGELQQLANLCHNCRACHYACQYTAPHEFAINVPAALAEVRQQVWQENASPKWLARLFHRSGAAIAAITSLAFALLLWLAQWQSGGDGAGFYAVLPHNVMVALFLPAFILPLISVVVGLRQYWRSIGGNRITSRHVHAAMGAVSTMKNLAAGHGEGCNFEDEDRFSHKRRLFHQATMYGFLLCFAATSAGTIMHYVFDLPAPYSLFSVPKLLGLSGGILLCIGTLGLAYLKTKADPELSAQHVWGGEMGFILLLFSVSSTGLLLYAFANSAWLPELLALHLGTVLAFFVLIPFSKMVHGFYRLAALVRDEQMKANG